MIAEKTVEVFSVTFQNESGAELIVPRLFAGTQVQSTHDGYLSVDNLGSVPPNRKGCIVLIDSRPKMILYKSDNNPYDWESAPSSR